MLQTDRQTGALDRNNTTVPRDVAGARGEVRCWLFAIFTLSSATAIWCHLEIALNELRQLRRLLDEWLWLYSVSWRESVECRSTTTHLLSRLYVSTNAQQIDLSIRGADVTSSPQQPVTLSPRRSDISSIILIHTDLTRDIHIRDGTEPNTNRTEPVHVKNPNRTRTVWCGLLSGLEKNRDFLK